MTAKMLDGQQYYTVTFEQTAIDFQTSMLESIEINQGDVSTGLTEDECKKRLLRDGPNELYGSSGTSVWKVLIANIINPMNAILGFAMIFALIAKDWVSP